LILAPVNTLQNWKTEFNRWLPEELKAHIPVRLITASEKESDRIKLVREWFEKGGVLIIGYQLLKSLLITKDVGGKENSKSTSVGSNSTNAAFKVSPSSQMHYWLLKPGPDVLICDEAHIIKNKQAQTYNMVQAVQTFRRIALTGSPLQNNLEEYWCMVNWCRPNFLNTAKMFKKTWSTRIEGVKGRAMTEREKKDSTKRAYLLHRKLEQGGVVHRRDLSELAKV